MWNSHSRNNFMIEATRKIFEGWISLINETEVNKILRVEICQNFIIDFRLGVVALDVFDPFLTTCLL